MHRAHSLQRKSAFLTEPIYAGGGGALGVLEEGCAEIRRPIGELLPTQKNNTSP